MKLKATLIILSTLGLGLVGCTTNSTTQTKANRAAKAEVSAITVQDIDAPNASALADIEILPEENSTTEEANPDVIFEVDAPTLTG